jgi:hypothetical protein
VYAKQTKPHVWTPIYIGQTSNLNERQQGHHKKDCLDAHGATHVHIYFNSGGESVRLAIEADLIEKWQPPCNTQGVRQASRQATSPQWNPWQT